MSTYKQLRTRIQAHYGTLPAQYKAIAGYYLENFDSIPFITVQQLAKATETNDAAIVRFAQKIGFSGFSQLRDEIAQSLQKRLKKEALFPLVNPSSLHDSTLSTVANREMQNIGDTVNFNQSESFNKVVQMVISSERIFTVGLGISHLLAEIIAYQFNQIGYFASALTNNHSTFLEQILFMNQNDALIALSLPPYSKDTIEAVKYAREKKVKTIALTNKTSAPVCFYSDAAMIIKSENLLFTNSFAAISVLINALVTECALKNEARSTKWLNKLKSVTKLQQNTIE